MGDFYFDRDNRGRPAEYLTVEYFRSRGIPAYINEAPEEDRAGRASHDVVILDELWDVKTDWYEPRSKRIFVEKASLEHTRSCRFAYWLPTPYGFDVRILKVSDLIETYNARRKVSRGDGTFFEVWEYAHGNAGEQPDNHGVFIPIDITRAISLAPWQVAKELSLRL